jgi:CrcB protein
VTQHASAPAVIKVGIGTGLIGAFTTFSTLAFESLRLLREGAPRYGLLNLVGSTAAGLLLAAAGLAIGGRL